MANNPSFGKLESVDIREGWQNEAANFTPWLAEKENISLLGQTIGMELELEGTERTVGSFNADILCKDTRTGYWVLVENQLERTDHTHLGQILTYAAGLDAVTIVWIAAPFRDEHQAALHWLNEITDERFNFFGLEIELWRIGESIAAPKFNIVVAPNDWSKSVARAASSIANENLSDTRRLQLEFWTALKEFLEQRGGTVQIRTPPAQNWITFGIGRTYFGMSATLNVWEHWSSVYLALYGADAKMHFQFLHDEKEEIEKEFGQSLEWRELPEGKESHIRLQFLQRDPENRSHWPDIQEWMAATLERFDTVFRSRIRNLSLD
ncbi:MAG: DUF4268 domain-containing protein [Proteobacteria bacterium]|nr:DUF4268 domain-containing protein [Pseudomonadota bacterium]